MKKTEIYERIARFVGKSPLTIKNWDARHPELYELVEIGEYCKSNGLTIEKLEKMIELQKIIKGQE